MSRDERGSALVEVTWLGILLMVPLVYIVLSVFEVQRGAFAVSEASRAGARAYSLAGSDEEGQAWARAAVAVALADQGVPDGDVDIACEPSPRPQCLEPGNVITLRVQTNVDLPLLPDVLGGHTPSIRVDAVHSVPYDQFRQAR